MTKLSSLKGRPVVSLADGSKIGSVQDVLVDTAGLRVTALLLTAGGGRLLLPFQSVRAVGHDAVTIESAMATHGAVGKVTNDTVRSLRSLTGLHVVNQEGERLGTVKEWEMESSDGRLSSLLVTRGGVFGLGAKSRHVLATAIQAVGPRILTVNVPDAEGQRAEGQPKVVSQESPDGRAEEHAGTMTTETTAAEVEPREREPVVMEHAPAEGEPEPESREPLAVEPETTPADREPAVLAQESEVRVAPFEKPANGEVAEAIALGQPAEPRDAERR